MIRDIQMKLGFILFYAITFYFFHFWNQICLITHKREDFKPQDFQLKG